MFRCPFPGCAHTGDILTNLHCQTKHNMSRNEIVAKYGSPQGMYNTNLRSNKGSASRKFYTTGPQSKPTMFRK